MSEEIEKMINQLSREISLLEKKKKKNSYVEMILPKDEIKIQRNKKSFFPEYTIVKKLGAGAFGAVYLVKSKETDKLYAIKSIKNEDIGLEEKLCSILKHKNIVQCYEVREFNNNLHFLFEYANGGTLKEKIINEVFLPEKEVKIIIRDILNGLVYCHEKHICHYDLKPDNILIFQDEKEGDIYKIADWGLAEDNSELQKCLKRGTCSYIAPEIWIGKNYYCDKTDIWSVGVIAYYCIEGKLPYKGETRQDVINNILINNIKFDKSSPEAQDFIRTLLNSDSNKRPTSKEALQEKWLN